MNRFIALVATIGAVSAAASAQNAAQASEPLRNVLTIQPLGVMLGLYAAEYERATGQSVTWGLGATHLQAGDAGDRLRYTSGDFKLRYYPSGDAPRGFSLGGSVGIASIRGVSTNGSEVSAAGASLGMLLEYQWFLGAQHDFAVALGVGAKANNVTSSDFINDDLTAKYPTMRISVSRRF